MADTKIIITAQDKTRQAAESVRRNIQGIAKEAAALRGAFAGFAGVLSLTGLAGFVKSGIDAIDALNDLSERTNVSVQNLGALQVVAKLTDTSIEAMGKSINKLSVNLVKNRDDFAALGVTARDPLEAFIQLAGTLEQIEDVQLRAAVAERALGKSYEEVLPALRLGAEGLREQIARGRELVNITPEMAKQASIFNDQLDILGIQSKQLAVDMANDLLPSFNNIVLAMQEAARESGILKSLWVGLGGIGDLIFNGTQAQQQIKRSKEIQQELKSIESALNNGKKPLKSAIGINTGAFVNLSDQDIAAYKARALKLGQELQAIARDQNKNIVVPDTGVSETIVKQKTETELRAACLVAGGEWKNGKCVLKKEKKDSDAQASAAKREAEALARAEQDLQQTLRENAQKFNDAQIDASIADNKREYDAKTINAQQYYDRLLILEQQRAENELRLLQANVQAQESILSSGAKESEKAKARAEISDLQTQISVAETKLRTLRQDTQAQLANARKDEVRGQFDAVEREISQALERQRLAEQRMNDQTDLGLPQIAAEQQINQIRQETLAIVSQLIERLQALADANGEALGTDAQIIIERYKTEMQDLTVVVDTTANRINSALQNGFEDAFTGLVNGTKTVEQAFADLFASITREITSLAARNLSQQLMKSIFGGLPGDSTGGLGGLFSMLLGSGAGFYPLPDFVPAAGFAEGGYTGSGGKYQPKGIVHGGEFVFSKQATSRIGVAALEHMHRMATGAFLPQYARTHYDAGGLVNLPQQANASKQEFTIINAIDRQELQDAAFGGGATRKLLNIISADKRAFKSALGV